MKDRDKILLFIVPLLVLRCTSPTTSPTTVGEIVSLVSEAEPPQSVPEPIVEPGGDLICTHWNEGGKYIAQCQNGRQHPVRIFAVVYKLVGGNEQHRYSLRSKVIDPGKKGRASAPYPDCGQAQGDTTADEEPPLIYHWPDRLPGYVTGSSSGVVDLGPCEPPPPCEPSGEPECPEQVWDTESCQWVGECPSCCDTLAHISKWSKYFDHPLGNPSAECIIIPMYLQHGPMSPSPTGELIIRKGGKCYEVTTDCSVGAQCARKVCCNVPPFGDRKCFDESHVTRCTCIE